MSCSKMNLATLILACMPVAIAGAQPEKQISDKQQVQAPESVIQRSENGGLENLPAEVASQPAFQLRHPRYQLRPTDTVELSFAFTPEFNQTVTVQPDGYVSLKDVGDLYVHGNSVPELQKMLNAAYSKLLNDPVISVVLKDFEKPYFVAGGELRNPGKYEMRGTTTVTEAVTMAGGFTGSAKHSEVLLFRRVSEGWVQVTRVDVKRMLHAKNLREDLHLRPGDMVFVPKNRVSKIKEWLPAWRVNPPML
jgi:polysaccharide export outer membrane protein